MKNYSTLSEKKGLKLYLSVAGVVPHGSFLYLVKSVCKSIYCKLYFFILTLLSAGIVDFLAFLQSAGVPFSPKEPCVSTSGGAGCWRCAPELQLLFPTAD